MNKAWIFRCAWATGCLATAAAQAQALADRDAAAAAPAPVVAPLIGLYSPPDGHAARTALPLRAYAGGARVDESLPLVTVITLPPEPRPGRPPGRNHHALSLRNDSSTQALRAWGFDVTDCATRFRFPSRFRQSTANEDGGFEASAQVSWLCRF